MSTKLRPETKKTSMSCDFVSLFDRGKQQSYVQLLNVLLNTRCYSCGIKASQLSRSRERGQCANESENAFY